MPSRGLLAAALALLLCLSGLGSARAGQAPVELHLGASLQRPTASLARVLRRGRLGIRYTCMRECDPQMKLRVGGVLIGIFDPPGGPTAGNRAALFRFDAHDRRVIRAHTGCLAHFRLAAVFTARAPGRDVRSLHFTLRR